MKMKVENLSDMECMHAQFHNALYGAYMHSASLRELEFETTEELVLILQQYFDEILRKFDENSMRSAVTLDFGDDHYLVIYRDGASSGLLLRKEEAETWIALRDRTSAAFFRIAKNAAIEELKKEPK